MFPANFCDFRVEPALGADSNGKPSYPTEQRYLRGTYHVHVGGESENEFILSNIIDALHYSAYCVLRCTPFSIIPGMFSMPPAVREVADFYFYVRAEDNYLW